MMTFQETGKYASWYNGKAIQAGSEDSRVHMVMDSDQLLIIKILHDS